MFCEKQEESDSRGNGGRSRGTGRNNLKVPTAGFEEEEPNEPLASGKAEETDSPRESPGGTNHLANALTLAQHFLNVQ